MPKISNVCFGQLIGHVGQNSGQLIGHVGQNSGNLLDTLDKFRISSKLTHEMATDARGEGF